MTNRQAPRGKVAQRLLSAAAALVLSAWMYPSVAATGTDVRPDRPLDAPPMSLSADRTLPRQVIDQRAAAADPVPQDDSTAEASASAGERPQGPRVEIMLRRIFEEAQARQPKLPQQDEEDDFNAPLAVDKSDPPEDAPRLLEAEPAEAAAEFPGFGADELLRYRQQMYRTDI